MTGFTDFPNELIVEVWRHVVHPGSIENFALTNKRIHALGSKFIEEHNELKAKFSSILHYVFETDSGPAETFKALLQNPRAALYVRVLLSDDWQPTREGSEVSVQIDQSPNHDDTRELLRQSIKDSPFILENEIDSWLDTVEARSQVAFFFSVLMMLPNLRSFALNGVYLVEPLLFDTIKRITGSGHSEALSQLTEVRIYAGRNITEFKGFDWVFLLAALPTVKVIKAWDISPGCECFDHNYPNHDCIGNCYGPEENYHCNHTVCRERQPALLPKTSSVTHLTFGNCFINIRRLVRVLEGLQALESFEWVNIYASSTPKEIVNALLDHARYTLRRLRIRSSGLVMSYTIRLAEFQVMKELDIGYNLLFDHRVRGEPIDMLPPSIEIVQLSRTYALTHEVVSRDVLEMTTEKVKRFPNLKELTINLRQIDERFKGYIDERLNASMILTMKQKCEDVGVHFNIMMYSRYAID